MYREIKFEIVYETSQGWVRKPVVSLFFTAKGIVANVQAEKTEPSTEEPGVFPVHIDWGKAFLFQSAGVFDKVGNLLFHGHLLKDEAGKLYEVMFANGSFFLADEGVESEPAMLSDEVLRKLEIIGDIIQQKDLLKVPDEKIFEKHDQVTS